MNKFIMYFCCKICKIRVSNKVDRLEDKSRLCFETEKELLPRGYFFLMDKKDLSVNFERCGLNCDFESYSLNLNDVINTKHHSDKRRLAGCCGLSGYFGINTVCANNHEIGMEYSDCAFPHTMSLVFEKVELVSNE